MGCAIFGGEHSGHFYFRDNWYADSGLIAFLTMLELLSRENASLSEYLARHAPSGPRDPWMTVSACGRPDAGT